MWNITKNNITERMTISTDQAWSVPGPTPPPKPLSRGIADPLSNEMKAGKWEPALKAQSELVNTFKKNNNMK